VYIPPSFYPLEDSRISGFEPLFPEIFKPLQAVLLILFVQPLFPETFLKGKIKS
jgi:hypothetical protein